MKLSSFCVLFASILLSISLTSNSALSQSTNVSDEEIRDFFNRQLGTQIEYAFDASAYDPGTLVFFRFIPSEPFKYTQLSYYEPKKQSFVGVLVDDKIEYRPVEEICFGDERLSLSNQGFLVESGYRIIDFERNKEAIKNVIIAEYEARENYESSADVVIAGPAIVVIIMSFLYVFAWLYAISDIMKNRLISKKGRWVIAILLTGAAGAIAYFINFNRKKPLVIFGVSIIIGFSALYVLYFSSITIVPQIKESLSDEIKELRNEIYVENYGWFSDNGFNNMIVDTTKTVITDDNHPLKIYVSGPVNEEYVNYGILQRADPEAQLDAIDELIERGDGMIVYPKNFTLNPGDKIYIDAEILSNEENPVYCGIHIITEKPNWVVNFLPDSVFSSSVLIPCHVRNSTYKGIAYYISREQFLIEVPAFAKSGQYEFNFVLCKAGSEDQYSYPYGASDIYYCTKESDNYWDDATLILDIN